MKMNRCSLLDIAARIIEVVCRFRNTIRLSEIIGRCTKPFRFSQPRIDFQVLLSNNDAV